MQAIEFEAIAHNHTIRIPDTAPDGVPLQVLLQIKETEKTLNTENQWKNLLASMPEVGEDDDFSRPKDYGRELLWDI